MVSRILAALVVLLGLTSVASPLHADGYPGDFDYYVRALSWSPTYCASPSGRGDFRQCGTGRRYSFVVHGLWPQYQSGWPSYCRTRMRYVPNARIREMLPVMPSKRLIIHQWRKHGSCTGLSQKDYFGQTRELFARFQVPARYVAPSRTLLTTPKELVHDFVTTNLWLKQEMLSVQCGRQRDRALSR